MQDQAKGNAIYDVWAPYWDAMDIDRTDMLSFYHSLIGDGTGSLIEIACGTGRITGPLAADLRRRHPAARIVGIDNSKEMLQRARKRDARISWVLGDMRAPPVKDSFDLAICCFNVLQEMLTDADMVQALSSIRRLLSRKGRFAFDIYQPNTEWLNRPLRNHLARSAIGSDGRPMEVREDTHYDSRSRIVTFDWRLVPCSHDEEPPVARMQFYVRQYFPDEIDRLLAAAGLKVCQRYGDFDKSPFAKHSKKQILICAQAP